MKLPVARRFVFVVVAVLLSEASAESVYVKYHGRVELDAMRCEWITRSSFVERICYEPRRRYPLTKLRGTYYHYCGVPASVLRDWLEADSLGRHYNAHIKGEFDCRLAAGTDAPPSAR